MNCEDLIMTNFQLYNTWLLNGYLIFDITLFLNTLTKLLFSVKFLMLFIFFISYNFLFQNTVVTAIHLIYTRLITSGFWLATHIQYKRSFHDV